MGFDIVQLRHELHAEPEIGLHLPLTQAKVLAALDGLPLEVHTGKALSSVVAVQHGSRPGPTVLLRADMDALPVQEHNDLPYASRFDGVMHACGHDMHTAMLVGAAHRLSTEDFAGKIVYMFQPGEEGAGGAKLMVHEEGVLDVTGERPVAAFGVHVIAHLLPRGLFVTKGGPVLAACDVWQVTVRGAGGHSAQPHTAKDPILAACAMVTALQTTVTRTFDIWDPVVVTVTSFHAGDAQNVIPDDATFSVTARSFSREARDKLFAELPRVTAGLAAAHGLESDVEHTLDTPVTVNNDAEAAFAGEVVRDLFGPERFFDIPRPLPASEDFSFVLDEVPGAFIAIGACPGDPLTAGCNRSPEAKYDDAVLPDGAQLYATLALRRLAES